MLDQQKLDTLRQHPNGNATAVLSLIDEVQEMRKLLFDLANDVPVDPVQKPVGTYPGHAYPIARDLWRGHLTEKELRGMRADRDYLRNVVRAYQAEAQAERDGATALREKYGALDNETWAMFLERTVETSDAFKVRAQGFLTEHVKVAEQAAVLRETLELLVSANLDRPRWPGTPWHKADLVLHDLGRAARDYHHVSAIREAIQTVKVLEFKLNPDPCSDRDGPLDREKLATDVLKLLQSGRDPGPLPLPPIPAVIPAPTPAPLAIPPTPAPAPTAAPATPYVTRAELKPILDAWASWANKVAAAPVRALLAAWEQQTPDGPPTDPRTCKHNWSATRGALGPGCTRCGTPWPESAGDAEKIIEELRAKRVPSCTPEHLSLAVIKGLRDSANPLIAYALGWNDAKAKSEETT